jgi:hypothetical protein
MLEGSRIRGLRDRRHSLCIGLVVGRRRRGGKWVLLKLKVMFLSLRRKVRPLVVVLVLVVAVCGSETGVWIWLNRCTFAGTASTDTDAGTRRMIALAICVHRRRLIVQRLFGPITVLVDSEGHCSRYIRRMLAMQQQRERGLELSLAVCRIN